MTAELPLQREAQAGPANRAVQIVRNLLIGLVLIILTVWLVLFLTKGRFLKQPFEQIASSMSEREVKVGGDFQLYFAPVDIKFLAERFSVSNPEWASKDHLLAAEYIETRIAPLSLLFGATRLRWLDLKGADIDLEWDAAHRLNSWTFKGMGKPLELPSIRRAAVRDTSLRYQDPQLQLVADIRFNEIAATNSRIADAVRFTGGGKFRATPFTLSGALLSPNETLAMGQNRLELHAATATDTVDITGTLPSLAQIDGAPLSVAARGGNAAALFAVIGIVIPDTRHYQLQAEMLKQGSRYRFRNMKGQFGASDIAGSFTLETGGPRRRIAADLVTQTLDIVDVAPFMGYDPNTVSAKGFEAAAAETGAPSDRLLPDASLRAEGLRAFDADVRYRIARVRAKKMPVTDVDATVKLTDGLLALGPVSLTMAGGKVISDIRIDWRRKPARTVYDIRLAQTPLARLLKGYGVEESGTSGLLWARAQLTGDGDTLHQSLATSDGRVALVIPKGTFWTRNVQLVELDIGTFIQKMFEKKLKEPVQINCGLIAFTVRKGVAGADPILIDTAKNVILGRGGFSFVDESLNLTVRADAKKFSLLSAQSPVRLGGKFAEPSLQVITPELLGRGGTAVGLAAVVAPPAAILAFVDVGDAKAADCAPVLGARPAVAQRTEGGKPRDDVGAGKLPEKQRKKFLGIF